MAAQDSLVYLNGEFMPLGQAKIPVLDRGFLFGDSVYEVIPVYAAQPFRLAEHLRRLEQSLAAIRMTPPLDDAEWERVFQRLINGPADQYIYLQVTRGVAPKRDHAIPPNIEPTVFAMCSPIAAIPAEGVRAVTVPDIRWLRCDIKATTLLANVLLRQDAVEQGAVEAILIRDGYAIEGAASNLFVVTDSGVIVTPPKGNDLLPGITRDLVLELAAENHIPSEERRITESELRLAPEVWVTSSTREVLPIIDLDGAKVGEGLPGPVWLQVQALYQDFKRKLRGA